MSTIVRPRRRSRSDTIRSRSLARRAGVLLGLLLAGCSSSSPTGETPIAASAGGTVTYKDELTLQIPPGTLAGDVAVKVEKLDAIPEGDKQGFTSFGQGYRLSPHGTEFSLFNPAILKVKYDRPALVAAGLDPRTLNVFYLDEDSGRYLAVAGTVDEAEGVVVARVEHFSVYLPMAQALAAGSPGPTIAIQSIIPARPIRNAPTMIRATVRDAREGDAIASVTVKVDYFDYPSRGLVTLPMHREPGGLPDTWVAEFLAPDFGSGDELHTFSALNNFGLSTTLADPDPHLSTNVWRWQPITVVDQGSPTAPTSTLIAGATTTFATTSTTYDSGSRFVLVPEYAVVDPPTLGTAVVVTGGVRFTASAAGVGVVKACVTDGGHGAAPTCGSVPVKVTNGDLARLVILDENSQPFEGTRELVEGRRYSFDVRGEDAWGNRVLVTPSLRLDPGVGVVDALGVVDTLDGDDYGTLTATLGPHTAVQHVRVAPRQWQVKSADLRNDPADDVYGQPAIAMAGATPYVAYCEGRHPQRTPLHVKHWDGARWIQDGGSVSDNPTQEPMDPSIAIVGGAPWVAYAQSDGTRYHVHVRRWDGASWLPVGAQVQIDGSVDAVTPVLAVSAAGTPSIAWAEGNAETVSGASVLRGRLLVKHWNGSEWIQDGLPLNRGGSWVAFSPRLAYLGQTPYVAYNWDLVVSPGRFDTALKRWDGMNWVDSLNDNGFAGDSLVGGLGAGRLRGATSDAMFLALAHGHVTRSKGLLVLAPGDVIAGEIGDGMLANTPVQLAFDGDEPYALWTSGTGLFVSHHSSNYRSTGVARWTQNGPDLTTVVPGVSPSSSGTPVLASGGGVQWVVMRGRGDATFQVLALEARGPGSGPVGDGGMSVDDLAMSVMPDLAAPPDLAVPVDLSIAPDFTVLPDLIVNPDLAGALCKDGLLNQGEADIDCGGPCPKCVAGKMCGGNVDCASKLCAQGRCALQTSFGVARVLPVNPQPQTLAVGDVTGDAKADLVTASFLDGNVSVLAGNGNGTFAAATVSQCAAFVTGLALGDWNRDARLDVAVLSDAIALQVLLNQGKGALGKCTEVDASRWVSGQLASWDVNGDGDPDVVSGGNAGFGGARLSLGLGNGAFAPPNLLGGQTGASIASGDVDGDGALDLINADAAGIGVHLGKKGSLLPAAFLAEPLSPTGVAAGDLDGDGFADVVAGYEKSAQVGVYRGSAKGTLGAPSFTAVGKNGGSRVALADFDGDGRLDLAVANSNDSKVWVLHGHGDGTFDDDLSSPSFAVDATPRAVLGADLDGDGKPDLAVACSGAGTLNVLLNISR